MKRRFNKNDNSTILGLLFSLVVLYLLYLLLDFMFENVKEFIYSLLIVGLIVALIVLIFFCIKLSLTKYDKFIFKHSIAIRQLSEINAKYQFISINDYKYQFLYDNEAIFDTITPKDYLIYQLQFSQNDVKAAILSTNENAKKHLNYQQELKSITGYNKYDAVKLPLFKFLLYKKEEKIFNKLVQKPSIEFNITVNLILTNIQGYYKSEKHEIFNTHEIDEILSDLNDKSGTYYNNDEIWQSICKVERGKVTNKLRFFVYDRDRNRCVICGSKYDLEIDHIFPISKGGKSTPDNLQTLCHNCNVLKSNEIVDGAIDPKIKRMNENAICPLCGAPTILKKGKYGQFMACSRYPQFKYTKSINR